MHEKILEINLCIEFPKTEQDTTYDIYNLQQKIRIGYVLKSADVGTLFSRRNSENTSHIHAHLCTPTHTHALPPSPAHARAHLRTPPHTLAHTPNIPTDVR